MNKLWLLTEERPKPSVISQIIETFCNEFKRKYSIREVKILPVIKNNVFTFLYSVEGINVEDIDGIYIKTVSGSSSFIDFLLFEQENVPNESSTSDNLVMAFEETKTSDDESRNTGVFQRGSKFVYVTAYYPNAKLYMLYNEELNAREEKRPSDTSIFGTNILLTLGVTIIGKDVSKWNYAFSSLDDLIAFKQSMRKPPAGNTPLTIKKFENHIEVSGRLSKPFDAGNIGHDPNIGALSMISAAIRKLGWQKDIIITNHGVSQQYIDKTKGKNKFLYNCKLLNLKLADIVMPSSIEIPEQYWHYEISSEKIASILLHVTLLYSGCDTVYENHAGCERGYFITKDKRLITLPKKDKQNNNLFIPDLVTYNKDDNSILLVEGKKLSTLNDGIREIENYDSIELDYINVFYPGTNVERCISIFGGNKTSIPDEKVVLYLNDSGKIYLNPKAPNYVTKAFDTI